MNNAIFLIALFAFAARAQHAPYPPFTAQQAELGKQLAAKSAEVRKQITDLAAPAEPFKIMGNLYFIGNANGEVFLLTSPQGHIMLGTAAAHSAEAVQHNIENSASK
jgi:metallo-beta-lactamase class B